LRACEKELKAIAQFKAFQDSIRATKEPGLKGSEYYLLKLNTAASLPNLSITGYRSSDLQAAILDSTQAEQKPDLNVVLVSVRSMKALRRAYPNYFADTESFLRVLKQAIA
jgi:hypothetical protein